MNNIEEKTIVATIPVTFRDKDHFYKVIRWLNANVGSGTRNWTFSGRVLNQLKRGETVTRDVYVYNVDFDVECTVYLALI